MRYFRTADNTVVCEQNGSYYDLSLSTSTDRTLRDLLSAASIGRRSLDEIVMPLIEGAEEIEFDPVTDAEMPLELDEIWGAGVTYSISQESREGEGSFSEAYIDAYEHDRPEVYFKATPSRTVGPTESIGVRSDSDWNVPEPELSIVLYEGNIVGYTIGNDVCSREIERQNLLYLPQSKIYDRSCAVGPCVVTPDTVGDPHELDMAMRITRNGDLVFEGETSTSNMVRTVTELTEYFKRCNHVPEVSVLLTGTSIIPPDDVTLRPGDVVEIDIENIGMLRNPTIRVS